MTMYNVGMSTGFI